MQLPFARIATENNIMVSRDECEALFLLAVVK
jgi:hypothetical protein